MFTPIVTISLLQVDMYEPSGKTALDVETWMAALERQMRVAVRDTMRSCLEAAQTQSLDFWVLNWPAQCLLLCSAVLWCRCV